MALLMLGVLLQGCNKMERPLYQASFETNALDKVPEEFMVLDGAFAVKQQDAKSPLEFGNKFLELPGAPLDTFGLLLGPTEGTGAAISARIYGLSKGRRFPTFAVGLNGVGGYKLQVSPAKNAVELFQGEDLLESAPFSWQSGTWTRLRLQTRKTREGKVVVEGKAWKQGDVEPKGWQISRAITTELPPGRPSIWGMPFAGTPIRFDDLLVTRL